MNKQTHLSKNQTINLGSYYTPKFVVDIVYDMLGKYINFNDFVFLDSSCGYGDFFTKNLKYIGADIDEVALKKVSRDVLKIHTNSLLNLSRDKFEIQATDNLVIIGNPPYNDKTSIVRNSIKKELFSMDKNLEHRDLGISFMRSFEVLKPEFVCVLHPLSYLIKQTNFNALAKFKNNYKLIDAVIISSEIFTSNSNTFFPIIIALYEKNSLGMSYEFIKNYEFKTYESNKFCLSDFDFIGNYVQKYPNHNDNREAVAYFHTLRDINALKRNRTFVKTQGANTVKVFAENLKYYCYIDHFKRFANNLPYYFGNLDVFIDNNKFLEISDEFLNTKGSKNIDKYFKTLIKNIQGESNANYSR
ncbi:SAM-dependent methyltransferase [Campylobacter sp. CCUG 57310]|uniref:SAM-dependent methyltransferase n=1 Tax=Campylobacter sp. CCUG 57310 TaxID=2517362 RepID=UPI0020B17853|nr:SAM-dependent methyltransferase [Campylobacter sp. CCUG 57310]